MEITGMECELRAWTVNHIALVALALLVGLSALPVEARSKKAVAEFKRENPCPANGNKCGSCPGYQVDHLRPLKCGGADVPANMQWLTISAHAEKTKREAKSCRNGSSVPE